MTVDRFAKGLAALLALVLIKPWGLGLNWQQISYASLAVMALWVVTAVRARREYLASFRRSIERREVEASAARPDLADPATVEALVEELAHPDEQRVLYAIDLLEALEPPPAGLSAAAAPRVGEGARAGPAGAGGGSARAARALGGYRRAPAGRRERRGAGRRGARTRRAAGRARGRADAALPGRPRPARGHGGGGDARRQRARRGRRGGRGGARAARRGHARDGRRRDGARWRRRSARSAMPVSDSASSR